LPTLDEVLSLTARRPERENPATGEAAALSRTTRGEAMIPGDPDPLPETPDPRPGGSATRRGSASGRGSLRVLIVSSSDERLDALARAFRSQDVICTLAGSVEEALGLIEPVPETGRGSRGGAGRFEAVLYDLPRVSSKALGFLRNLGEHDVAALIVCPEVSFDEAVQAMRAGACDIICGPVKARDISRRVWSAVEQRRAASCGTVQGSGGVIPIGGARPPESLIAGSVPGDVSPAPDPGPARERRPGNADPRAQSPAELVKVFGRQIRCELDVEVLLRHALEFVLGQAGPTNAAVFLPSPSGDYSLGAYVNFSCPKDTVEVLLDHLANVAAPRLERVEGVRLLTSEEQLERFAGVTADWIGQSHAVTFVCGYEGEPLAVFLIFRDASTPFPPGFAETMRLLSRVFGEQLARVVRIHHRHLPRDQWGTLTEDPDDGHGGLAA
jgi:ActR/RegA family two-component response regulator